MNTILIMDGQRVLVSAEIDVPARKIVSLMIDDEDPLRGVFVGLSLLDAYIQEEMGKRADWVEKNRSDKTDRANSVRPEPPTCEGGCE